MSQSKEKRDNIAVLALDKKDKKLKVSSGKWIEKNREVKDKKVDEELYRLFHDRRQNPKKKQKVDWKWLEHHYKVAYKNVHGEDYIGKPSGSLISKFLENTTF